MENAQNATKQQKLEEADQHIAKAESLISRQLALIDGLKRDGHATDTALTLLAAMREGLRQMYTHRGIIAAEPEQED